MYLLKTNKQLCEALSWNGAVDVVETQCFTHSSYHSEYLTQLNGRFWRYSIQAHMLKKHSGDVVSGPAIV